MDAAPIREGPAFRPGRNGQCQRAERFSLLQFGLASEPAGLSQYGEAMDERQAGIAFHEDRAEAARKASGRQAFWWAVLLVLLGIALLLIRALIESRR